MIDFLQELDFAVTICDDKWSIVYMNDTAAITFEKYGGNSLIGSNLLDCHNDSSRQLLVEMKAENKSNTYTIEKSGVKKLIHQAPIKHNGKNDGFIELSIVLPDDMAHLVRS